MCYQGVSNPIGVAHEVLDPFVHQLLGIVVEEALIETLAFLLVLLLAGLVLAPCVFVFLAFCIISITSWFFRLREFVSGLAFAREDSQDKAVEEGLDDVHHIRAEVPDHIELVQHRQRTPVVDACCQPDVFLEVPGVVGAVVGCVCFCASLGMGSRWWRTLGAESSPQGVVLLQPPKITKIC